MTTRDDRNDAALHRARSLGFDAFEQRLLLIARHFLMSHASPGGQTWRHGFLLAADQWGEPVGLAAAHHLSNYIAAVLRFRKDGVLFHEPKGSDVPAVVTEDEALIMAVLHYLRREDIGPAREAVIALTHDRMDREVVRTGLAFAARFSAGVPHPAARQNTPRLRVIG